VQETGGDGVEMVRCAVANKRVAPRQRGFPVDFLPLNHHFDAALNSLRFAKQDPVLEMEVAQESWMFCHGWAGSRMVSRLLKRVQLGLRGGLVCRQGLPIDYSRAAKDATGSPKLSKAECPSQGKVCRWGPI
jgi:hypothetical protein